MSETLLCLWHVCRGPQIFSLRLISKHSSNTFWRQPWFQTKSSWGEWAPVLAHFEISLDLRSWRYRPRGARSVQNQTYKNKRLKVRFSKSKAQKIRSVRSFCLAFCLYFAVSFSTTQWYIFRISGRIACKFTDSWESQHEAQWEAQWPNGQCTGLRVGRPRFETWPRLCVVFLEKTLCSHSASPHRHGEND